uniref:Ig-like domain-containing protein n=1 Tax=Leptobrachium leishanense TaxID=445787 RepID=A0A8C5MTG8_9ANUR
IGSSSALSSVFGLFFPAGLRWVFPALRGPCEVKVCSRPSGSAMKLHCQVYGFHPRDVDVNWKKNGMDIPSDEAKQVLPNSDGTYQLRASVEVTPEDGASYSCHVDHSSLDEPLLVMWGKCH